MQISTTLRVLGIFLMMFSLTMVPPALLCGWYQDDTPLPFVLTFFITLGTGFALWWPYRNAHHEFKTRDGFLIVALFWLVICLYGALPFMIAGAPHSSFTDAVFEAVSGLTTTGSTVLTGLDYLPHGIRYYRQQLQFVGGMGIIVLAVAILPMLGIGGMQLYRAETPGPVKDSKLTPRITETAKTLWYIYVGLTALCAAFYWAAGMTPFDAIGESFATISTGGFAMHDNSFSYYNNPVAEIIGSIFMLLGAVNFGLHFIAVRQGRLQQYWHDSECRAFLCLLGLGILIPTLFLTMYHFYPNWLRSLSQISFNVISLATTTGYLASPIANWPTFLPIFIFFLAMIGGCGGSTSGGVKVMRLLLLTKHTLNELRRLIHPNAIIPLKYGQQNLPHYILETVWAFIATFVGLFVLMWLILIGLGLDITTAFGALAGCIANAGQGLGLAADNFATIGITSKWILIIAMLLGRLEIFTLLILFTPAFWRN